VVAAAAALGFAHPAGNRPHVNGPPLAHSGGFGEPTCRACHFDRPLNEAGGSLALEGLPERWIAGEQASLEVVLSRPQLARAGFQLSVRFSDGERAGQQAGRFRAEGKRVTVRTDTVTDVDYAQHTRAGTKVFASGPARWRVMWEAPAAGASVTFHVAGNASNDDDSEFGDSIYTTRYTIDTVARGRVIADRPGYPTESASDGRMNASGSGRERRTRWRTGEIEQ
jgi:hypothetical protein